MPSYLERYQNGECEQVWAELTALGEQVRQDHILPDALAVARETMSRVRENAERIISRLQSISYEFDTEFDYPPAGLQPPPENVENQIKELENQAGFLPLSLRAWYEVGGGVNFMGTHPLWPDIYTDPLVIAHIEVASSDIEDWQDPVTDRGSEEVDPLLVTIAPDYYHKADESGGASYKIEMPCAAADAVLLNEWHHITFVECLRECFRWGGFPGFDISHPMNPQHLNADAVMPPEHLALLTADLLPI